MPHILNSHGWKLWTDLFFKLIFIDEGRRRRGQQAETVGWHRWFNGHEFEQTLGDGEGQGSLACCIPWGRRVRQTEQLNNSNNLISFIEIHVHILNSQWVLPSSSYVESLLPTSNLFLILKILGPTEDEMVGWHHWLNGHEFEQTLGDGERQGSLVCCSLWSCRVGHDWVTAHQQWLSL